LNQDIQAIIDALNQHLIKTANNEPSAHITCNDGTVISIQAGQYNYSSPKNNQGPWTEVETWFLKGGSPTFWTEDDGGPAGYVPIEDVAKEIFSRGCKQLASN
tara:strand:+ start:658 stop:966 length:309 start_codon:yes stop_codon:yes gene_type:complete